MNYIITGKNFTSPLIEKFRNINGFSVLSEEELENSDVEFLEDDKIYCPDETSVPFLRPKMTTEKWEQLEVVKNKNQCRVLLKDIYPDFYFKSVGLDDLKNENLPISKQFIIKPQKGFFGVGVREINSQSNLKKIVYDIKEEIHEQVKVFSEDVFSSEDFIIEEFISGEEYSFDLYYNESGEPVLTSFCHHPLSKNQEYFHLLYYTGKDIYVKFKDQVLNIFKEFNKTLNLKNMPVHAEFKESNGKLVPIEFNVPRFGGFGLADLPYHAFGENPFVHFFDNTAPDWENIFEENDKKYAWVLCYNPVGLDLDSFEPDYDKLLSHLGNVIHLSKLNYKKNPVFGIAYIELENEEKINDILAFDFNDFFKPKKFTKSKIYVD